MTGCYSNGVWRCRWGLFFTSSQLLDTYTQTHSHVHTRGHLLYDTVLFSVCFTLKWFPPAGYCFTFVTHSTASTALSSYSPVSPKHTCVHTLICNEKHKYTHIHTHTITACRLAALLWFPSASSRSWGENEWEGCCSPGHKKRRRRNTEGGEKKNWKQAVACEPCVKCKPAGDSKEGRGVRRRSWEVKVDLHSKGDVLVQASSCDLLTSLRSVNHKHSLVKRKWMSFRHDGAVIWG